MMMVMTMMTMINKSGKILCERNKTATKRHCDSATKNLNP